MDLDFDYNEVDDDYCKEYLYTVYCKDNTGVTLLKKAFRTKSSAYKYALNKIKRLLTIINDEFKNTDVGILPLHANIIYVVFQKKYDIEQYEYFKENYEMFFKYIVKDPVMFFVARLEIVD
jgi:hypothetical protein